jgi:hypothetical protein
MGAFNPQLKFFGRFAFSPHKETSYGAGLADAKFTRSTTPLGFDDPEVVKTMVDNEEEAWKGSEFATEEFQTRQAIDYALNFRLSALLAGYCAAFSMADVDTVLLDAGPPAAYKHTIIFQDRVVAGHDLPSTGHWFKPAAELAKKIFGAVCLNWGVAYTRGQPVIQLNSNWSGSGEYLNADLANVPALDTVLALGYLREAGLDIKIGTPATEVSVADRVASISLDLANGLEADYGYYPSTGLYRGRAWMGRRAVTAALRLLASATDDIFGTGHPFGDDDLQGLRIAVEGDVITATYHHNLDIYVPNMRYRRAKVIEEGNFVAWDLQPKVFQPSAAEVATVVVQNTEAAYLGT